MGKIDIDAGDVITIIELLLPLAENAVADGKVPPERWDRLRNRWKATDDRFEAMARKQLGG
jgi:hypothetical protein